jgi:hypothetical protein
MRQRASFVIFGIAVCLAVVALGSAGIASGAENSVQKCNVSDTGQDLGRDFCIDAKTFSGITASDTTPPAGTDGKRYTWVEFSMTNTGGSTLTNPRIVASLTDFCGAAQCTSGNPPAPSTTSQFVDFPANCTANAAKTTLTCNYANIPATNPDASTPATRVYLKTGNAPATASKIDVQGTVKERANDSNPCQTGDPNCDTVATSLVNSYEPDENAGVSFALNAKQVYLTTNDKNSSFAFKSKNASPFRSDFLTTFPSECGAVPSPTCFYRTLSVTATFDGPPPAAYNDGPVVFYGRVTDLPSGVNQNNLSAIHTYDDNTSTVIGDVPAERSTKGCTFQFSAQIPIPSICVKKQGQTFDVWVWDAKNGQIKWT